MSFDTLGLSPKVLAAVETAGFETPTPIQEQSIPIVLAGRDLLGLAQTGTGKTASFTLPILTRLEKGRARARMPRILILEPTRELAVQVHESFEAFGSEHRLTIALLIGGVSFGDQDRKLDKGADVLIATPGRLLDHFGRGKLMMNGVEVFVVDEADRMLDMGFIPDIERICKLLPPTRQTLFFSATMPPEIQRITSTFLKNPERVEVSARSSVVSTITQKWVSVPKVAKDKRAALRNLIETENIKNAIVFCNRKRDVATLETSFERRKLSGRALHGDMDQHARLETLRMFKAGEITYLIASDVAARGLDIPDVSHVLNYDIPDSPEDYVHRIGRTGRAGKEGTALGLVTKEDSKRVAAIEKLIGEKLEWLGNEQTATEEEPKDNKRGRSRRAPRRASSDDNAANDNATATRSRSRKPAEPEALETSEAPEASETSEAKAKPAPKQKAAPKREKSAEPAQPATEGKGSWKDSPVPAFLQRSVRP